MSRALVTGATGFVGRALCAELRDSGWQVVAGDQRQPGWEGALQGVDALVHLAAVVHTRGSEAHYRQVNVEATERLALAAKRAGVRRLVFVSTIKVNGEETPVDRPFRAADAPAPQDAYARSKWQAEQRLAGVSGLEVVVVRPPLVYGPGVRANFRRLLQLVDTGVPLPFASIRNRRSLIYVGNLAALLRRCAEHPRAAGATLLAADGEDVSTPDLVQRMGAALGRPARLLPFPAFLLPSRLTGSLTVDATETGERLEWQPPYPVDEGLARTVAWYRS
ncbi:MAG: UDP-N-acetyl-alpha-D-quinovosamine dehydrogenase [Betaproteobacteria bacterium]|nr:UDP-N-acetyl-alpha-D-quinovosamine dehydrogenase [Betaproteobacteria bacterium]